MSCVVATVVVVVVVEHRRCEVVVGADDEHGDLRVQARHLLARRDSGQSKKVGFVRPLDTRESK